MLSRPAGRPATRFRLGDLMQNSRDSGFWLLNSMHKLCAKMQSKPSKLRSENKVVMRGGGGRGGGGGKPNVWSVNFEYRPS